MLSDNGETGVFYSLLGIVAVFLVAIAFAGFARSFSFADDSAALNEELSGLEIALHRQETLQGVLRLDYQRDLGARRTVENDIAEQNRLLNEQGLKLDQLKEQEESLSRRLAEIGSEFNNYRDLYRTQSRSEAIGETIDSLTTRSGKVYSHVTIRQVSPDGMSITYDGGVVRLGMSDLDPAWTERFDWEKKELKEEESSVAVSAVPEMRKVAPPAAPVKKPVAGKDLSNSPEAAELRVKLYQIKIQLNEVSGKISYAREQGVSSKAKSVPGSLETWEAYLLRMQELQGRLLKQYSTEKAKLKVLSPKEPEDLDSKK